MTTAQQTWTRHSRELAGVQTTLVTGGSGEPVLVLHDETGYPGWLQWQESLSQNFNLNIPMMPGYGESARLDWAMSMRDMTGWYLEALDDLDVGQVSVIGFSLGGWLAAELATMDPEPVQEAGTGLRRRREAAGRRDSGHVPCDDACLPGG